MTSLQGRHPAGAVRSAAALLTISALILAGCVRGHAGAAGATPSASTVPSPTARPSGGIFYLRAWQTQALAPENTFTWLPVVTISNGQFIDGQVAVIMIYPGPLWAGPSVRTISQAGIDTVVAEARRQGLFDVGTQHDFVDELAPGSVVGHLEIIVDSTLYELSGDPTALMRCRCIPEPGTNGAFAAFWQRLTDIPGWLGAEVGQAAEYKPDRLAVLTQPPVEPESGITPNEVDWPLTTPFAEFGIAFGSDGTRCAVIGGTDVDKLLPVVKQANQLTRFVDSSGARRTLLVRTVVPGEPGPCMG
jgi:hypothetical protein